MSQGSWFFLVGPLQARVPGAGLRGPPGRRVGDVADVVLNVLGVSLPLLRRLLAELGFGVTELWA
jgi:hypothetical protein